MGRSPIGDNVTLRRASTAEHIADLLRRLILEGNLPPGEPLREVALARSLGVARGTLREAERILVTEGILKHQVQRGVTVALPSTTDLMEVYQARRLIEPAALARLDASAAASLGEIVRNLSSAFDDQDYGLVADLDADFHRALVKAGGNSRLSRFHANIMAELRVALHLVPQSERETSLSQHERLLGLLRKGDQGKARLVLLEHLDQSEDELIRQLPRESTRHGRQVLGHDKNSIATPEIGGS